MSDLREAAQQALEELEALDWGCGQKKRTHNIITALRAALAKTREHVTDGSPCWCNPETTYVDPDTGASGIVHKEPQ